MRVRALAILVLLLPAAFPAVAQAHASLLRTDPAAGSEVARAPAQIVLHFDQQIADAGTTAVSSSGASVLAARAHPSSADVRALVVPLKPGLKDGDYTVRWKVVSTDGHIVSGVMAIGVGLNRPPPQAATTETSALDWPYLIARFFYYCGLMLLVGGAVFRVWVFRPVLATLTGRPREMAELRERARANSVLLAAAVLMLAGGWVALTREGAEVAGVSFWQAFNHRGPIGSALQATRFGREFGRGVDLGAAFCIATAAAFAISRRSRVAALVLAVPAFCLGVWAVIVPGLSGHAGDPGMGTLAVAVDALHTAAAAIWIGGLVQLVVVTPHATRGLPDGERSRVRTAVTARFSRVALASVVVLAATGVGRALWEVATPSELWQTGYGRALLAKTALLACLVALGYRNRRNLAAFGAIRRRGAVEIGLLVVLLAVVSLLTDLPPANTPGLASAAPRQTAAGGPVSLRLGRVARLALWPGYAGRNAIDLRLPGNAPTATVVPGSSGSQTTLRRAPGGTYAGFLLVAPRRADRTRDRGGEPHLRCNRDAGATKHCSPGLGGARIHRSGGGRRGRRPGRGRPAGRPPGRAADAPLPHGRCGRGRDRTRGRARGNAVHRGARRLLPGPGAGEGRNRRRLGAPSRPRTGHGTPADAGRKRAARGGAGAGGHAQLRCSSQPAGHQRAQVRPRPVGDDPLHHAGAGSARDRGARRRGRPHHR